jgi:hypothetical protein
MVYQMLQAGLTRNYVEGHKKLTSKSKVIRKVVPDPGPQRFIIRAVWLGML